MGRGDEGFYVGEVGRDAASLGELNRMKVGREAGRQEPECVDSIQARTDAASLVALVQTDVSITPHPPCPSITHTNFLKLAMLQDRAQVGQLDPRT